MNKLFDWVDNQVGPDRAKYPKACLEAREMVMDCVLRSDCFKVGRSDQKYGNFKFCMQEGIDKPCKALRYDYYRCKRTTVFWEKSLRDSDTR